MGELEYGWSLDQYPFVEHYLFNKDDEYLRDYAYPLMKEQLSFV